MTLPYFTKFNNILTHFDSDRLCNLGPTQGNDQKSDNIHVYIDKQQQIDIYLHISPNICWEIKLLKITCRFILSRRGRLVEGLEFFPGLFWNMNISV